MKNLLTLLMSVFVVQTSFAASVCMFRTESSGITSQLKLYCSIGGRQSTIPVAEVKSVRSDRTQIYLAKVNKIRQLIEQGYQIKTDDILVKN